MQTQFTITGYNKTEFRLVTMLFIILLLRLIIVIQNQQFFAGIDTYPAWQKHNRLTYFGNYLLPWLCRYASLYACYVLMHFVIIKKLVNKIAVTSYILACVGLFVFLVVVWHQTEIALYFMRFLDITNQDVVDTRLFTDGFIDISWIVGFYILYIYLKYSSFTANIISKYKLKPSVILRDCVVALAIWVIISFFLNAPGNKDDYMITWVIIVFPAIPVYAYASIRLIPLVKSKGKGFWNYLFRLIIIAGFFVLFICILYGVMIDWHNLRSFFLLTFLAVSFHPLIVGPVTWLIYHARLSKAEEITGLKTALGQSSANLDFLRSQINPHFLFNVLNTLYGTALQENAERTGEGIQKLGDMMRFMLQENVQEQISLMREVDYLKNYIALQKLRTQSSADIVIKTEIEESVNGLQIAPMLLIPFVENAFKHGISLREPSHIKMTLHTEGTKLLFDVYNSIHPKAENDPEKNKSGIGLENVKQRLQLLYPERHDLIIRESAKEFFIHLTIQL